MSESWRPRFEQRSRRVLLVLSRQPRWLLAFAAAAVFLGGLFSPGVAGAVLLLLIVAVLVWLLWFSWPAVHGARRLIRLLTIAALLAVIVAKLT